MQAFGNTDESVVDGILVWSTLLNGSFRLSPFNLFHTGMSSQLYPHSHMYRAIQLHVQLHAQLSLHSKMSPTPQQIEQDCISASVCAIHSR